MKKDDFDRFYDDALAYLDHSIKNKTSHSEILSTLIHDIGGIVRKDPCFLPRVSGWANRLKKQKRDFINGILESKVGNGKEK